MRRVMSCSMDWVPMSMKYRLSPTSIMAEEHRLFASGTPWLDPKNTIRMINLQIYEELKVQML